MHSTNTSNPVDFPSWEEMTKLEQAQCTYWDMYKDAYGVRPRGIDTSTWTFQQFEVEFAHLSDVIDAEEKSRKEAEKNAVVAFTQRINELIKVGAKDYDTALRWIHEAEGSNGDDEYLCFLLGLPYQYFRNAA
jgi:hypothetical protein